MNFKSAAFAAAGAFVLSFLSALIGGVSFFDMVVRALFWSLVAGGLTWGAETLLRMVLPDLFQMSGPAEPPPGESPTPNRVDISLEDEPPPKGFVEEMEESDEGEVFSREREKRRQSAAASGKQEPVGDPSAPPAASEPVPAPSASPGGGEELPEIGAFLDSFKGQEGGDAVEESSSGEAAYTPPESELSGFSAPSQGVTAFDDGQEHDPAVLAKAVQTVLKKDQ